jgi:hypothetical protein
MGTQTHTVARCKRCPSRAVEGFDECIRCLMEPKRSRHKYKAEPTILDGIRFDSKFESEYYAELKILAASGEIADLALQPEFPLIVNGNVVAAIVLDFCYTDWRMGGKRRYVDVKGVRNRIYRLKKKMFEAQYGVTITEITRPTRKKAQWKIKTSRRGR